MRSSYGSGTGDPQNDVWGYNDRNELTATDRFTGTGANSPGGGTADDTLDRDYAYDPIGNRTTYGEGTAATKYYCTSELNQYATIDDDSSNCPPTGGADESLTYDDDGNLTQALAGDGSGGLVQCDLK